MPDREKYKIREMREAEYFLLKEFLYEAIFIPEGITPPPKSIVEDPLLQIYTKDFGSKPDDKCFVAEVDGKVVGAVWVRIINDFGHIDDDTPSFSISLYREYRNRGIGTEMMKQMLEWLTQKGYKRASLSVQKANYATRLYLKVGFEILEEKGDEYIMLYRIEK
ncbi:MAG: GNAT family N-acetyltransferase [Porphyromonas sp.]|nr:GNAT family N-acetyltransferase [Porphyromonas sp.]